MHMKKHVLVKKLKIQSVEWKHTDSLIKKKVPGKEEDDADSLLGHERPITIDFFEKSAMVNRGFYCQLLRQYSPYLLNDLYIFAMWYIINNLCFSFK